METYLIHFFFLFVNFQKIDFTFRWSPGLCLPLLHFVTHMESNGWASWMFLTELLWSQKMGCLAGSFFFLPHLARLQSDSNSFIPPDWFIHSFFLQELHILHEGFHVPHGGGEWHRPLLQLQDAVLWEGRAKQKQRHYLPGHWGLYPAGSGAWDCVVQGNTPIFF